MTTPKSILTILKTLIFLTINLQSHAYKKSPPPSRVPSPSPLVPPQESDFTPQYTQFLKACEKRLTPNCSDQIVEHLFGKGKMSLNCCSKLIETGPDCHKSLIDGESNSNRDYDSSEKTIAIKTDNLWKKCEKSVPPPKDMNYPRFPARQFRPKYDEFLQECAEKTTEKCGAQIVDAIFKKNKKVGRSCCKKLLRMGRECHDELIRGLRNLGEYEKDEKEVMAKSGRVWKHCEYIVKHD